MEKVKNIYKNLGRPVQANQMPWIVIYCGNKDNIPHGKSQCIEFFDSRFDIGRALPRLDMPEKSMNAEFSWDCYRINIGATNVISNNKTGGENKPSTGYKSGERVWDSPEGFFIECRNNFEKQTARGIQSKQCHQKTWIRRDDWNEVLEILKSDNRLEIGGKECELSWQFLGNLISNIQTRRNAKQKNDKNDTPKSR